MELKQIIAERIKQAGPISFKDFMEMALYYPELGYYNSERPVIGKEGDFFTSPSVSPAFGAMISREAEKYKANLSEPLTFVEYGAGNGSLCNDIIKYFSPEKVNYYIIEKSKRLQEKQKKLLGDKVKWVESISEIHNLSGVVLSNEVPDNFAVHVVYMDEILQEIHVDYKDGKFIETMLPASDKLKKYFSDIDVTLPKGYRTEVNLEAIEWINEIEKNIKKGIVITIDYGFESSELYSAKRREGTITCYHNHKINYDPYINVGDQDITTHINFSALQKLSNLKTERFTDQASFLAENGLVSYLQDSIKNEPDLISAIKKIGFVKNMLLFEMGPRFKVLVQSKGI